MAKTNKTSESKGRQTRKRILDACRKLFNQKSPNAVTTAEIASALGIREGNLQYHFPRKETILEALFEEFEEELVAVASAYINYKALDDYAVYLPDWFNIIWRWRFYYRDPATVLRIAPSILPRLKGLSEKGRYHIREVLQKEQELGLVKIPDDKMDSVIANAWIIWSHWFDYIVASHGIVRPTQEHMTWGVYQVNAVFSPYYTKKGRGLFEGCG